MSTKQEKIDRAFKQAISGISGEKAEVHRSELLRIYKAALDSLNLANETTSEIHKLHKTITKNGVSLKNNAVSYTDIGIKFEKILPKIDRLLREEGDKFKGLFSSIGVENEKAIEAFTGSELEVNSIRLNLNIIEPTAGSATTSISIANDYNKLTDIMVDFYVSVVLGGEKSVKLKGNLKNATVLVTGLLGLAPAVGIPASLTNLFISIKDMYSNSKIKDAQTRLDQLERLSAATELWVSALTEWKTILKTHNSVMNEKISTINDMTNALSTNYKHWKSRINTNESHNNAN